MDIIKDVQEKDLEILKEMLKNTFNNNISYEEMKEFYKISKNDKNIHVLGYYINDNLVGTITLNISILPSGKDAIICDFSVKEEYRRLGIGTKLMNKAEEIAKMENVDMIYLFSGYHRKGAHELYKKLGYDGDRDRAFIKKI